MRRLSSSLLAAILACALSSCLAPVDAGVQPADGAVDACASDDDCAAPNDRCDVLRMSCVAGRCTPVLVEPGTCPRGVADCDCNAPPHEACAGAFECLENRCVWKCPETGCATDRDCPQGSVCEPGGDCQTGRRCVAGCHAGAQCRAGELCLAQQCKTCPCPGQCGSAPSCTVDTDCPRGSVCDFDPLGSGRKCQPGCHTDMHCGADEHCVYGACADCVECPCIGTCLPKKEGCAADSECPAGRICAQDWDCTRACVAGCRSAKDCRPGETCMPPLPGSGCGFDHGTCAPAPSTCSSASDCPAGTTCGWDESCRRACVPGCRGEAECATGQVCAPLECQACWCATPQCHSAPWCTSDTDCVRGTVCEYGPGCTGSKSCVGGCHADSQCAAGERCEMTPCTTCPCPGACVPAAPKCASDRDCGPGLVCEPGPGCASDFRCVPGCHDSLQCAIGERCLTPRCSSCPCPGSCQFDVCLDADGDGYVWSCRNSVCPGMPGDCDCDDKDPAVHPQATERCGNGRDDDCDGSVDEGCACPGGVACVNTIQCALGQTFCQGGCCTQCPSYPPPPCAPNSCLSPGGVDHQGCPLAPACVNCCSCPATVAPVCGTNYATYNNACEAGCAGVPVLHDGACLVGEGLACGLAGMPGCPAGQYCRDVCPVCDLFELRCTKVAACTADWDCPAGLAQPPCSKGPGTWTCVNKQCQFTCP